MQVCQDNHAYVVDPKVMDNPLPIQGQDAGQPGRTLPFRAHIMYNGTKPAPLCDLSTVAATSIGCFNDTNHQCGFTADGTDPKNDWVRRKASSSNRIGPTAIAYH